MAGRQIAPTGSRLFFKKALLPDINFKGLPCKFRPLIKSILKIFQIAINYMVMRMLTIVLLAAKTIVCRSCMKV
jgi:hypothetical protein